MSDVEKEMQMVMMMVTRLMMTMEKLIISKNHPVIVRLSWKKIMLMLSMLT